jgi:hypothetical protein
VLKLQKCPDLDALLELLDAVLAAAQGPAPTLAAAARLEQILPALETVALPKGEQVDGAVRHLLDVWKTAQLAKLPREMREKASKKKPNPRDFARLAAEMREELAPWLELSLRGAVLAFYLRGEDLPVSEDALLLRKYQYRAASETDKHLFPPPEFTAASDGAGSTPSGSLAGMAEIAGRVAVAGRRGAPGFAEAVESKQIGSLRNSFLWRVDEEAIRALHLSVLAGREWLVDAAASEPEAEALLEACEGLVSPERQTHLEEILTALRGLPAPPAQPNAKPLADRESFTALWEELWEQLSVSDLFWLGRQRRAAPPESLAWKALSQLPASVFAGRIQELGGLTLEHARSSRPRLAPHPAYEDYAAQMMPARLAERLSELPFALACAVDEAGLPAEALALTAEPLSRNLFETLSMSDLADFRSVLALWRKVDSTLVRALYEEEMTKIP